MCDRNMRLCAFEKPERNQLVKIFRGKFTSIIANACFPLGVKLRRLFLKLIGSCKHSVMDIALEAKQVFESFSRIYSDAKYN